jgi:hypothetical protein
VVSVSPLAPIPSLKKDIFGMASVVRLMTPPPNSPEKFGE